jgi:hypothetical protein
MLQMSQKMILKKTFYFVFNESDNETYHFLKYMIETCLEINCCGYVCNFTKGALLFSNSHFHFHLSNDWVGSLLFSTFKVVKRQKRNKEKDKKMIVPWNALPNEIIDKICGFVVQWELDPEPTKRKAENVIKNWIRTIKKEIWEHKQLLYGKQQT